MDRILGLIFIYLLIINIWLLILMWADKRKSRKESWRVKEKTLWIFALLGGSFGGWAGMKMFRHKTKHRSFSLGFPVLVFLQLAILVYVATQFYL